MAEQSGIEKLREKYKVDKGFKSSRDKAHDAFEKEEYVEKQRLSQQPKTNSGKSIGELHGEYAAIEESLAELADNYGKLNADFGNTIGKKGIYSLGESFEYHVLTRIPIPLSKFNLGGGAKKRKKMRISAATNKGNSLEYLVGQMGEVLREQYHEAIKAKENAMDLQLENIDHLKTLDRAFITRLTDGYDGTADYAEACEIRDGIVKELEDFDSILTGYEEKVKAAKAEGDIVLVKTYTEEMTETLEIKHGVLNNQIAADGVITDIRRNMMESAEGVQSAKNATAATKVNYKVINALIDSMNELEFKYKHAIDDFLTVFEIQAKAAAIGRQGLDMQKALMDTAAISQRLMESNADLVKVLANETFKLVKTDLYDARRANQLEDDIDEYMRVHNEKKVEWAEAMNRVSEIADGAHYGQTS